jgi:hypothetical protein
MLATIAAVAGEEETNSLGFYRPQFAITRLQIPRLGRARRRFYQIAERFGQRGLQRVL